MKSSLWPSCSLTTTIKYLSLILQVKLAVLGVPCSCTMFYSKALTYVRRPVVTSPNRPCLPQYSALWLNTVIPRICPALPGETTSASPGSSAPVLINQYRRAGGIRQTSNRAPRRTSVTQNHRDERSIVIPVLVVPPALVCPVRRFERLLAQRMTIDPALRSYTINVGANKVTVRVIEIHWRA